MTGYLVSILTFTGFFMILALALNLQWGMTGMVNFAIAGFYGLGAYTSGLLSMKAGVPVGVAVAAAPVVGAILGAGLAALAVRLREDFFAIATLGFGETMRLIFLNEDWLTNGPRGLPIDVRPMESWVTQARYPLLYLALVLAGVAIAFALVEAIRRAPYGRALRAIREDDVIAEVMGKPVLAMRITVFALGSALMAGAGALYAHYTQNISPDHFTTFVAIFIWMAVILGGAGNNWGLVIGAGAVMAVLEGSRFLADDVAFLDPAQISALRLILIGSVIIAVIRFRPQGLVPEPRLRASRFRRAGALAAHSPQPEGDVP